MINTTDKILNCQMLINKWNTNCLKILINWPSSHLENESVYFFFYPGDIISKGKETKILLLENWKWVKCVDHIRTHIKNFDTQKHIFVYTNKLKTPIFAIFAWIINRSILIFVDFNIIYDRKLQWIRSFRCG